MLSIPPISFVLEALGTQERVREDITEPVIC